MLKKAMFAHDGKGESLALRMLQKEMIADVGNGDDC